MNAENNIFKHITAVSKNAYFDVLDDIVKKYNENCMLNTMEVFIKKILNLKLATILKFQNTKSFFLKDTLQTGRKKLLLSAKLKIQFLGLMLLRN